MACVQCGSPLRRELLYCTQCGARQPEEDDAPRVGQVLTGEIFFIPAVLAKLADGAFFRRFFAGVIYALAATQALGGLLGGIYLVDHTFRSMVGGFVGYVVFLPIMLVGLYMMVHATLIRAGNLARLPGGTAYAVIPVFALLLRYLGEQAAILGLTGGVLGCLTAWFGTEGAWAGYAPPLGLGGLGFLAGLYTLGLCALIAVGCLVLAYFLAEFFMALVDMAVHSREIAANTRPKTHLKAAAGE